MILENEWLMRIGPSLVCAFALALAASCAQACDTGSVRLWAFDQPRDVHKLCVIANADDAEADALHASLASGLAAQAPGLNIELVRIKADDPELRWPVLALPSAPPSMPVTVLVGWDGVERRPFLIDHWEPAPSEEELEALVQSPVRDGLKRDVLNYWAVLLYARGTGETGGAADAVVDAAEKRWAEAHPPGVAVMRLDRTDPKERLLHAFIGLRPEGPDWLGIVFGRGELLAPPLVDVAITADAIDGVVGKLLESCTCLVKGSCLGVDIPMVWEADRDKHVAVLGNDAYLETSEGASANAPAPAPAASLAPRRRVPLTVLAVLGLSVFIVVAVSGAICYRARR